MIPDHPRNKYPWARGELVLNGEPVAVRWKDERDIIRIGNAARVWASRRWPDRSVRVVARTVGKSVKVWLIPREGA